MTVRYPLIDNFTGLPSEIQDKELFEKLDSILQRINSMCTAYITAGASPSVDFGDNVDSASQSATGIYVITLSISYIDTDQYAAVITPIHATTDLFPTITATTVNTVTVKFSDAAGTDTDPTAFMIYTYGKQG